MELMLVSNRIPIPRTYFIALMFLLAPHQLEHLTSQAQCIAS